MLKYEDLPRLRDLAEAANEHAEIWWKADELTSIGRNFIEEDAHFIAALNPAAVIELLDMIERLKNKLDIVQQQADAGLELAQYASYAEIVGGVSYNRAAVRKWCDAVFDAYREVDSAPGGEDD